MLTFLKLIVIGQVMMKARNHHERVSLSESPLKLRLSWKPSTKDSSHLIGIYELDLRRLLDAGYVHVEPKVMKSDCASIMDMTI
jgi:hypothetical protein